MTADLQRQIDACLSKFDGPFGIAVSGGGDSMALLHLVAARVRETALPVPHVITVDHGLRADAAQEAEFVARTAQALGLQHRTLTWTGWTGTGNLQASARAARYHLLADDAQSNGLQAILLGHTADDDRAGTLLIAQDALEQFHHETQHGFWGHAFQWTGSVSLFPAGALKSARERLF